MTERSARTYSDEARDVVMKSGLTGVAATVMAVAAMSPAGFGGVIGTSSAFGFDDSAGNSTAHVDPYSVLPAFPAPLSANELDAIQTQLARSTVSMELTRAATDERIERLRTLAMGEGVATAAPMQMAAAAPARPREELRLTLSEPVSATATIEPIEITPISYGGGDVDRVDPYRDRHAELASLLLADDTF